MMDRPLALPNDLLDKAAEVRAEEGPLRIQQLLEDVEGLSNQDMALLNEVSCIIVASMTADIGRLLIPSTKRSKKTKAIGRDLDQNGQGSHLIWPTKTSPIKLDISAPSYNKRWRRIGL